MNIEDLIIENDNVWKHVTNGLKKEYLMNDREINELKFMFVDAYNKKHPDHRDGLRYLAKMNLTIDRFYKMYFQLTPYFMYRKCKLCNVNTKHTYLGNMEGIIDLYNCRLCGNTAAKKTKKGILE